MTSAADQPLLADFDAPLPEGAEWTGEQLVAQIEYGFGFEPLQQYLVATERGRLQVLPFAWDTRPAELGGQRWLDFRDPAQPWRGPAYNWNHACAECHSTGVRKNYDARRDAFATTFAELDVSCEACHGPASEHLRWAEGDRSSTTPHRGFALELRGADLGAWRVVADQPTAERLAEAPPANELDTCARCHSRRSQIHEDHPRGASLLDTHIPTLIEPPLYFDDGQIREEVYEYGSFLQSKMHGAGVTCSDCHDPHSLELHAPGNALCARCHAPQTFDTPAHHHHRRDRPGSACVDCHMPSRTYMQVDARRDHSLRVPRPDRSASLGAPSACAGCHPELEARALIEQMSSWGVVPGPDLHHDEILAHARAGDSSVADALVDLALAPETALMIRATAASLLASVTPSGGPAQSLHALRLALRHEHPLVRLGALAALDGADPSLRWTMAAPLLSDPVRAVRFTAVRLLAAIPPDVHGSSRAAFDRGVAELLAALELDADRAEAQTQRGNLLVDLGRFADAELAYARSIALDPGFAPAYVNWCDLLRRRGDELGCAAKLRAGLERAPDSAELHRATALSLIRRGRPDEAIENLTTAARLAPELPDHAYALVLALRERGDPRRAAAVLAAARARHPRDQALRSLAESFE